MNISKPTGSQTGSLRSLWKTAFGDSDAFLDAFFTLAFSPERCRCITENGQVVAAAYWFDTTCEGRRFAYLYAVATSPQHRNQGLCRALLEDIRRHLADSGYDGLLLVPQNESLGKMYERMGYTPCTTVREFYCGAGDAAESIRRLVPSEYARLRRKMLPKGGVIHEDTTLVFLDSQAQFYAGANLLAAVSIENGQLYCHELLGDTAQAPGLVRELGQDSGFFRGPGGDKVFAYFLPLRPTCAPPAYFGLALD